MMKWPTTNKTPKKPELSSLSDDQLDDLMVDAGLMEQDELDRQRDSRLLIAMANLPGGPPEYHATLRGLMKLRHQGPFPLEAQDLYDRLRARASADVKAARKAVPKVTPSPADLAPDTSMAGWLKARWASADEAVRHSLRAIANAVGIDVPLARTRHVAVQDSSPARRTESTRHPNDEESAPSEGPAGRKQRGYHDPPQWDDDADGWTPSESLTEALRDALHPEERGWY